MQIPSNWVQYRTAEEEKPTPVYLYADFTSQNGSFASIEIFGSESLYYDQNDAAQASLSAYKELANQTNFNLMQPIECDKYTLNKLPACSFVGTYQIDGSNQTDLDVLAVDPNGTEYEATFTATNDLYDQFLPVTEHMVKSISFDPKKVAPALNNPA